MQVGDKQKAVENVKVKTADKSWKSQVLSNADICQTRTLYIMWKKSCC